jgi:hypothetical protein
LSLIAVAYDHMEREKFCSINATQIADIYQEPDPKDREQKFAQLLEKLQLDAKSAASF